MKGAAYIDMDGTILNCESQMKFAVWCMKCRVVPRYFLVKLLVRYASYAFGFTTDGTHLRRMGFNLMAGLPIERIEQLSSHYFHTHLQHRIRRSARSIISKHRDAGDRVVLITAAMYQIATPVARELGIDEVIATRLNQRDGILTGDCAEPQPYREGKKALMEADAIRFGIGMDECFAYADHVSDLPMLESVGNPVAINPTRPLRRIARERNWPIHDWNIEAYAR